MILDVSLLRTRKSGMSARAAVQRKREAAGSCRLTCATFAPTAGRTGGRSVTCCWPDGCCLRRSSSASSALQKPFSAVAKAVGRGSTRPGQPLQRLDLMTESTCHAGGKLQERTWRISVDRFTWLIAGRAAEGSEARPRACFCDPRFASATYHPCKHFEQPLSHG